MYYTNFWRQIRTSYFFRVFFLSRRQLRRHLWQLPLRPRPVVCVEVEVSLGIEARVPDNVLEEDGRRGGGTFGPHCTYSANVYLYVVHVGDDPCGLVVDLSVSGRDADGRLVAAPGNGKMEQFKKLD